MNIIEINQRRLIFTYDFVRSVMDRQDNVKQVEQKEES
jgi:hypothetical protein